LGKLPVGVVDLSQGAFICPIECLGQFFEGMLDTPWEAFAEVVQLTMDPSEPTREVRVRVVKK